MRGVELIGTIAEAKVKAVVALWKHRAFDAACCAAQSARRDVEKMRDTMVASQRLRLQW